MIITITLNPAIDKTVYEDKTVFDVGGKGINVSKVLKQLNVDSFVLGFIGKDNKDLVIDDLISNGINHHFIEVEGRVRTNTKNIINGKLIENNEDGPNIKQESIDELLKYIERFNNDIVVISGSAPKSVNTNIYEKLIIKLKENNNYVILDTSKDLLKNGINARPNVIKPNKEEICKYFNIKYDEDVIIDKCKKLGIDLVCLSLGEQGAIYIYKDEVYKCDALDIKCSSSVGAGDAMVAGIAYSKLNNYDFNQTIKLSMALASSACETEGTKPPEYKEVKEKINKVIIKGIK